MSKKERIKLLESENDSLLTQCRAMSERIDGLKKDLQKMAADLEAAKSNSIDQIDPEKLAGALIEQAWITDVKPGAPEFNDLVSALGCNLWDKRYAVTPAEPEECVHEFIPFTSQCSKCGEPFKSEPEACPTCGEAEAFSGSCGTSKDDTRALCRRNAPVEPVGIINAIKRYGCSGFEAVIYATAIFEDRIKDGALIYTEPNALKGENELLRTELEKYQALYGAALVDLRDAKAEIEILREEVASQMRAFKAELATEKARADAAVGDANEAEAELADLKDLACSVISTANISGFVLEGKGERSIMYFVKGKLIDDIKDFLARHGEKS